MVRSTSVALVALFLLAASGCGESESATTAPAAGDEVATGAEGAAGTSALTPIELAVDPGALPTAALSPAELLADPCRLASVAELQGYLAFLDGPLTLHREERNDRPQCVYAGPAEGFTLRVFFDETVRLRSGEEAVTLAGVADIRRRVMSRAATAAIPFPEARDSSKRPANRLVLHLDLPATGWEHTYREEDIQRLIDGLTSNLVARLRPAAEAGAE